jgi:hypothetical protein
VFERTEKDDVIFSLWPDLTRPNGFDPILTASWVQGSQLVPGRRAGPRDYAGLGSAGTRSGRTELFPDERYALRLGRSAATPRRQLELIGPGVADGKDLDDLDR